MTICVVIFVYLKETFKVNFGQRDSDIEAMELMEDEDGQEFDPEKQLPDSKHSTNQERPSIK